MVDTARAACYTFTVKNLQGGARFPTGGTAREPKG